jgi:dTDP-4-amino-4,6-dideoxygalactose transaminase
MKQFGGEIQLEDLVIDRKNVKHNENQIFLSHGRAAIHLILRSIVPSGVFLLPSYLCESIIQPFIHNNIDFDFYEVDDNLNINIDDIISKIKTKNIQGLYIINYFGFCFNTHVIQYLNSIKSEVLIIEDYSHGSLNDFNNTHSIGHFVFSSLRKYLPIPDGCILINHSEIKLRNDLINENANYFFNLKFAGRLLKSIFNNHMQDSDIEIAYLKILQEGEKILDIENEIYSISNYSYNVVSTIDLNKIRITRQENFKSLLKLFSDSAINCQPIFEYVENDVSPFVFPVKVKKEKRDLLKKKLVQENLFCPILWPLPGTVNPNRFPKTYNLSLSILCLPVDQRYNIADMRELFQRVKRNI